MIRAAAIAVRSSMRSGMRIAARTGICISLALGSAQACETRLRGAELHRIEGMRYALDWRATPPIRVGEFFTLEVGLCARDGQPRPATLRVNATMPEHKHGMNYRPSVTPKGSERFEATGLMLHMPGRWELTFEVNTGAEAEVLRAEIVLP